MNIMRALALTLTAMLAIGTARAQQAPQAPSEQLVDRFMAALPPAQTGNEVPPPDPAELARLNQLNPGRGADVEAIAVRYQQCIHPVIRDASVRMLRDIARGLGQSKLNRLIEFYEGSDIRTFTAISDRADRGETLTEAETVEMGRIMASYPLADFHQGMQAAQESYARDQAFVTAITRCSLEKRSALSRDGLRAQER